jgi:hypothetical protein
MRRGRPSGGSGSGRTTGRNPADGGTRSGGLRREFDAMWEVQWWMGLSTVEFALRRNEEAAFLTVHTWKAPWRWQA